MLRKFKDYIVGETLGEELIKDISLTEKYQCDLNEEEAYIKVEKVK